MNIYIISISDFETKAIKKRNCEVAGQHGECMFVWQCLKTKGKHLGMCMDGFMFGSCCVYPDDEVHPIDDDEFENLVIEKEDNSIAATLESIETYISGQIEHYELQNFNLNYIYVLLRNSLH